MAASEVSVQQQERLGGHSCENGQLSRQITVQLKPLTLRACDANFTCRYYPDVGIRVQLTGCERHRVTYQVAASPLAEKGYL